MGIDHDNVHEHCEAMYTLPFSFEALQRTRELVGRYVPPTPQFVWPLLSQAVGTEVWVKHENATPTGAFKVRGGVVYVERLVRERPQVSGVVSATRGNHGQSLAYAGRAFGYGLWHLRVDRRP